MAQIDLSYLDETVLVSLVPSDAGSEISTSLSCIISEASPGISGSTAAGRKVTTVSRISPDELKQRMKLRVGEVGTRTVFVITEGSLGVDNRDFLNGMVEAAASNTPETPKILTVYYKVSLDQIPQPLRPYGMLDFGAPNFQEELSKIMEKWESISREGRIRTTSLDHIWESSIQVFIMVEVHPFKGSAKQKQDRAVELKTIREAVRAILLDPGNLLSQQLLDDYSVKIRDVSQSPLKVICKVKDEATWSKLKEDCANRTLGSIFMQHVVDNLQKDLQYEIKLIPQKDLSAPMATSPSLNVNSIFDMIKKKEFTTYDFYQKMVSFRDKINLAAIRSDPDGYNPLHALLVNNRLPLMLTLVQLKLFTVYLHESVPISSPSSFRGQTPRQLAESKKARRFRDALVEHEKLVHSMGKFLTACHDGDVALVRRMVSSNSQVVHEKDAFKNNCLYWALVSNSLELFILLLDYKADHTNLNESRESLLHVACMLGHHTFISTLMGPRCRLEVTATCTNKRTPLERVAENGDVECLKELLKHRVSLTACVLPYATTNGRLPFIKYCLEEIPVPLHVDSRDNTGRSALMKACETGRRDLLDYLLVKGASVNVEDLRRRTPLHVACENGHEDIVSILLNSSASLDGQDSYTGAELCFLIRGKDRGRAAWHYVEVRRNVVHIFLEKTRAGQVDVANYGVVVKSGWGQDPEKSIVDWVEKMFSDRRSSPSAAPDLTPLHMALYKQHPEVARMLIEKGANINVKDSFGLTPFMICALRNDVDTAMLLEKKGGNMEEKDKEGHTALKIAEMNHQAEMINYINGKLYCNFSEEYLTNSLMLAMENLQRHRLEEMRTNGDDVRAHIINTVRGLTTANNIFLRELGSGPIMKAGASEASQALPSRGCLSAPPRSGATTTSTSTMEAMMMSCPIPAASTTMPTVHESTAVRESTDARKSTDARGGSLRTTNPVRVSEAGERNSSTPVPVYPSNQLPTNNQPTEASVIRTSTQVHATAQDAANSAIGPVDRPTPSEEDSVNGDGRQEPTNRILPPLVSETRTLAVISEHTSSNSSVHVI